MRGRSVRLAVGLLGTAWALAGEAIALDSGRSPGAAMLHLAIGLTYLYGGLLIAGHDPDNGTGRLMAMVGLTWFIGTLAGSGLPLLNELALALEDSTTVLLLVLVLSYPGGRLETRLDRVAVAILAIGATTLNTLQLTTIPLFLNEGVNGLYGGLALAIMTSAVVVRRWLVAQAASRRELLPVLVAGVVLLVSLIANLVRRIGGVSTEVTDLLVAAKDLAPAAIPIALLIGFYRQGELRLRAADAELRESRARIVAATDAERRRLERDLHDGAQQRLVSLSLALRLLRSRLGDADGSNDEVVAAAEQASAELRVAIRELRELARGIHPAILTEAGLGAAITALAERSDVPAVVTTLPDRRLEPAVEAAAYFVVSEALANVIKYATATKASIAAERIGSVLRVAVQDDGVGGADASRGSGIRGLQDRVAAVGGLLTIDSPRGLGTLVVAEIPLG
jgi:signal transduction histidine kinase